MKLLLVDAYSLLFRAFYSSPPFTTKAGEPTGALHGFIRMVLKLLDENQPEFAVVCFDAHGPTFRHDADETYKANRSAAPDDLKIQTQLVRELLDGLSIPRYEHQGFEADDVIGTLAKRGAEDGLQTLIFTGDGDSLQLVSDQTHVYLTKRGVSELDFYDPAAVEARFGFGPKLVPDFKGLKGDTSDNIPGVPGIGDKTASALLAKWGSLEGVFENLEEVTPPRIRELLRTHQEQAFHSRTMATIVTDLPVEAEPESFRYDAINPEIRAKAAQTARRFEFKSLVTRYETPAQSAMFVEAAPSVAAPEVALQETESASDAQKWLEGKKLVAIARGEDGLMLAHDDDALLFTGEIGGLKGWLEDESASKIAHDAKSLQRGLQGEKIHLRGVKADTLLMSYLIEPTRQQHPIGFIAEKFLKYTLPETPAPKKKAKANLFDEAETSDEETAGRKTALASATNVLWHLEPVLRHELTEIGEENLFDELEMPLVDVLAQIECCGMQLDPKQLETLGAKLETDARRLEEEIWESAGEKFNIGSTKQLQVILYEKLGLEKGRTIKTGASTDVHTLERLAEKHEIVRKILDYRGVTKLKVTYVEALLGLKDPKTNRIHSTLNQTGAVSGRLSSTDPNLQNVPIRTEQGRQIRKAFIAPPGHVLLSADYSQIELRILAHITGDLPLVEAFQKGEDVHATTAAALFNVPLEEVDKEKRRLAKMTNYAIAYGVSGFGLAKQLGTGTNAGEANEFIKRYFETLPGVKKYIDDTLEEARKKGYVETLLGRRRPLPDIKANAFPVRAGAERTAINHPIQGTAADIMKIAMIEVQKQLREGDFKTCLTMQVHDELVFEVPEDEVAAISELVLRVMSEVPAQRLELKVPLVADIGTGCDWDSTKGSDG